VRLPSHAAFVMQIHGLYFARTCPGYRSISYLHQNVHKPGNVKAERSDIHFSCGQRSQDHLEAVSSARPPKLDNHWKASPNHPYAKLHFFDEKLITPRGKESHRWKQVVRSWKGNRNYQRPHQAHCSPNQANSVDSALLAIPSRTQLSM
jgi:hypothetical protein